MILISAGHNPSHPGACFESFCEHDEAVRWAARLVELIGDQALLVPTGTLRQKVAFINARSPQVAVEIHFNSLAVWTDANNNGLVDAGETAYKGNGACTLYCPGSEKGRLIAQKCQDAMEQVIERHWKGVMEGWYKMNPKNGPDFFLARTNCPAIILEPEFIHHKDEIQAKREAACTLIATALLEISRW